MAIMHGHFLSTFTFSLPPPASSSSSSSFPSYFPFLFYQSIVSDPVLKTDETAGQTVSPPPEAQERKTRNCTHIFFVHRDKKQHGKFFLYFLLYFRKTYSIFSEISGDLRWAKLGLGGRREGNTNCIGRVSFPSNPPPNDWVERTLLDSHLIERAFFLETNGKNVWKNQSNFTK